MVASFKRKRWREAQRLRLDLNGVMRDVIGEAGVEASDVHALVLRLGELERSVGGTRRGLARRSSLVSTPEFRSMLAIADDVRARTDDLVVLGTRHATEGADVLVRMLSGAGITRPGQRPLQVHIPDTIDPRILGGLLDQLDLRRTLFDVTSISGDTGETLAAFLIVRDRLLKELGAVEYKQQIVVATAADGGALRQIVHDEGFRDVSVESTTATDAAVLSLAALFPAACAGIDVEELLAGAAFMESLGTQAAPEDNPVLGLAAALQLTASRSRLPRAVLRPYAAGLRELAEWFEGSWARAVESERAPTAKTSAPPVGVPPSTHGNLLAPGAALDGVLTVFLRIEEHSGELVIPKSYEDLEAASYLGGLGLGAVMNLAHDAAEVVAARAGRASVTIRAPRLNAFAAGELLTLLDSATALVGSAVRENADGISATETLAPDDVRELTYGLAGRPGFEGKRAEAQRWLARKEARHVL